MVAVISAMNASVRISVVAVLSPVSAMAPIMTPAAPDATKLADALSAAGATCKVTSAVQLAVDLPASATSELVFRTARDAGLQIRGIAVRRESVEAAFLRVIGDAP